MKKEFLKKSIGEPQYTTGLGMIFYGTDITVRNIVPNKSKALIFACGQPFDSFVQQMFAKIRFDVS